MLERNWETPEELAEALVIELDKVRASRTSYVAVLEIGPRDGKVIYTGMGPYPGFKSAVTAIKRHPTASMARCAIVPIHTPEGFDALLKEVG